MTAYYGTSFQAFLNEKERTVVVLLRGGVTKLKDITRHLGYANHSPLSKMLTRHARKRKHFFHFK
jgi:uncharacterized membrane protein